MRRCRELGGVIFASGKQRGSTPRPFSHAFVLHARLCVVCVEARERPRDMSSSSSSSLSSPSSPLSSFSSSPSTRRASSVADTRAGSERRCSRRHHRKTRATAAGAVEREEAVIPSAYRHTPVSSARVFFFCDLYCCSFSLNSSEE